MYHNFSLIKKNKHHSWYLAWSFIYRILRFKDNCRSFSLNVLWNRWFSFFPFCHIVLQCNTRVLLLPSMRTMTLMFGTIPRHSLTGLSLRFVSTLLCLYLTRKPTHISEFWWIHMIITNFVFQGNSAPWKHTMEG